MDIQAAIDALPSIGGKVSIPAGVHPGAPLRLRDNVILTGEGFSTVIPTIEGVSARIYGAGLRDLICDTAITTGTPGITIDWRNVTNGVFDNVMARGGNIALLLAGSAYYNNFNHFFANSAVCAVELSGNANQNTFTGGKLSAPLMLREIGDVNGNVMCGTSMEIPMSASLVHFHKYSELSGSEAQQLISRCAMKQVRIECLNYGPYWLNY